MYSERWRPVSRLAVEMYRAGLNSRSTAALMGLGLMDLATGVLVPLVTALIIDSLAERSFRDFSRSIGWYGGLVCLQMIISYAYNIKVATVNERIANGLRIRVSRSVMALTPTGRCTEPPGDLVSRVVNDVSAIKGALLAIGLQSVFDIVSLIVVMVLLFRSHTQLALLTMSVVPGSVIWRHFTKGKIEEVALSVRRSIGAVTESTQSWFSLRLPSVMLGLDAVASERISRVSDRLRDDTTRMARVSTTVAAISILLVSIPNLCVFGFGGSLVLKGRLSIGGLFAFFAYVGYLHAPIQRLLAAWLTAVPSLNPVVQRLTPLLESPEGEATGTPNASPPVRLEADGIVWQYPGSSPHRLVVSRFRADKGELVGVVGVNGSGKSTLLYLLSGVARPPTGRIDLVLHGGQRVPASQARTQIGVLLQRPTLFPGSLAENLTLFAKSLDLPRAREVADRVGLRPWMSTLVDGFDTQIGGSGALPSGGTLQRLALAQVLYRDAPVMLLDEPTSGIDLETVETFVEEIRTLRSERVVVVVSHCEQLLRMCDRLYTVSSAPGNPSGDFAVVEAEPGTWPVNAAVV